MPPSNVIERSTVGVDKAGSRGHRPKPRSQGGQQLLKEEQMTGLPTPSFLDEMETPELVCEMLSRLRFSSKGERDRYEQEFKLSYYFEGLVVAGRTVGGRLSIIASGSADEVLPLLTRLPAADSKGITLIKPTPLRAIAAHLPSHRNQPATTTS